MPYVEYDEAQAICPQCGSSFRSSEVLEDHLRDSHAGPEVRAAPKRPEVVRCSVCSAEFSSISALGRHNREVHVA